MTGRTCSVIVIGVSAGGFEALKRLLGELPPELPLPILIVQHLHPGTGTLADSLQHFCRIRLKEADEGERIVPGTVYFAPPDYHLLVERDGTLALSVDPPVRHARPSVDVLFESAVEAFGPGVVGVILTGANDDGSAGVQGIKAAGGTVIVQDPVDAEVPQMPACALKVVAADYISPLAGIASLLCTLTGAGTPNAAGMNRP